MSNSATEKIADYITGASFSDLPDEVVRKAKFWMLDSIGCGFGGSQSALSQGGSPDPLLLSMEQYGARKGLL